MRILHCLGWVDAGAFWREHYYTYRLSKKNIVAILTSASRFKKNSNYAKSFGTTENLIFRSKVIVEWRAFICFRFKNFIDDFKPDIVHLYEAKQGIPFFIARYCVKNKIPYVYEHEQRTLGPSIFGILASCFYGIPFTKYICKHAAEIRVVTPGAASYLKRYISPMLKIVTTTLAYDEDRSFFNKDERDKFRAKFGISERDIVVCTTGTFTKKKRLDLLIDAFIEASAKKDGLKLFVIGNIDYDFDYSFYKSRENIFFVDKLLDSDGLNAVFCGSDHAIWTSATISYFEALGTGLKIYVPRGMATSHLQHELVRHYGDEKTIDANSNLIKADLEIQTQLEDIIAALDREEGERAGPQEFSSRKIVDDLEFQYELILSRKVHGINKIST